MGTCGELCAAKYNLTREEQDVCAIESFKRAADSISKSAWERDPIAIKGKGMVDYDDGPSKFDQTKLKSLPPAFQKDNGTITAGNASQVACCHNDVHSYFFCNTWRFSGLKSYSG